MLPSPRPSADDLRERVRARQILSRLDRFAHLAERWKQATCEAERHGFAERYRRLFGVDPGKHDELRAALERVRGGGRMPVEDVIAALNTPTR